ncbi:MAG: Ig-like domain-containing protein [Ruminococcus sp.]
MEIQLLRSVANVGDTESGIRFTSDNENVATVSADGTVTIKNAGTAKITVSMDESQNFFAVSKEVTVTVAPKEITVTPDNASKVYGESDKEFTSLQAAW